MVKKQDGYLTISLNRFIYLDNKYLYKKRTRLMMRQPSCFWTIRKPDMSGFQIPTVRPLGSRPVQP